MAARWWLIVPAAFAEVGWAAALKHADGPGLWSVAIALAIASLALALQAAKALPVSTVYAIFVGLGAAGSVMVDIAFMDTSFSWPTIGLVVLLLIGVIGLKLVSDER